MKIYWENETFWATREILKNIDSLLELVFIFIPILFDILMLPFMILLSIKLRRP